MLTKPNDFTIPGMQKRSRLLEGLRRRATISTKQTGQTPKLYSIINKAEGKRN